MTTSPLLLTLLCIQYDGSMALPPSRSEVYEEALEVLLKTWDGHRDINRGDLIVGDEDRYKALTFKRKMQLMSRLAYGTFKEGQLFIEQKFLEDKIVDYIGKIPKGPDPELVDGSVVLKGMERQHGLLVERATRIYSFSHLTLQEYFAAKYIVDYAKGGAAMSNLVGTDKITDPRWREVFLFVAELLPIGDEFVTWMAETLQGIVNSDEIISLVTWGDIRSDKRPIEITKSGSRIGFLTQVLETTFASSKIRVIERNRARALRKALDISLDLISRHNVDLSLNYNVEILSDNKIDLDFDFTLSLAYAHALALVDMDHDLELTLDLDLKQGLDRETISGIGLDLNRALALDFNYVEALQNLIIEGKKLNWNGLVLALERIPKPKKDTTSMEWQNIWQSLKHIKKAMSSDEWIWKGSMIRDIELLTIWLEGHDLLLDCLDRVILEDLDRGQFEDEYLYRLSS